MKCEDVAASSGDTEPKSFDKGWGITEESPFETSEFFKFTYSTSCSRNIFSLISHSQNSMNHSQGIDNVHFLQKVRRHVYCLYMGSQEGWV